MFVNVKESAGLLESAAHLGRVQLETLSTCKEELATAEKLFEETEREEQNSRQMLETARSIEEAAHAAMTVAEGVLLAAEAHLAAAAAAEAAAAASLNPIALAKATAELLQAQQEYAAARDAYEAARKAYELAKLHREALEKRYEMAKRAVNLAQLMKTKLQAACFKCQSQIAPLVERGTSRLNKAHEELEKYHATRTAPIGVSPSAKISPSAKKFSSLENDRISSDRVSTDRVSTDRVSTDRISSDRVSTDRVSTDRISSDRVSTDRISSDRVSTDRVSTDRTEFDRWKDHKPNLDKPSEPLELKDRLTLSNSMMKELLRDRYANDPKFRAAIDSLRERYKDDPAGLDSQVRKNTSGYLAEEIVKGAFAPYCDSVETQVRHELSDGGFTKTDLILRNTKVPLILGAGKGVREGRNVAIEVKSGREPYLRQQVDHIRRQAEPFGDYDLSLVICTRDNKTLDAEDFRQPLKDAGAPPLGMLPYKSEIDAACIEFVREGMK